MKRIFKTVVALGISLACLCTGVLPASAASYSSCDTNCDGVVNTADGLYVLKCMKALEYADNPAVLDANGNYIVSNVDVMFCNHEAMIGGATSKVKGCSKTFKKYTTTTVPTAGKSESGQFIRHTYASNKNTTYTLRTETSEGIASNSASPYVVIGDDTRMKDATDGIVCVEGYYDGVYYISTGFVVGDNEIVTAAHSVYPKLESGEHVWVNNVKVYLANSNGVVDNSYSIPAVESHIPSNYYNGEEMFYDYALITVDEDLSDHLAFNLGVPYDYVDNAEFRNYNVYVTGFPGVISDVENPLDAYQMYTGVGHATKYQLKPLLAYNTDASHGQSGAPVYVKEEYNGQEYNTVVAVHNGGLESIGYNWGVAMSPLMLKFFLQNPYAFD